MPILKSYINLSDLAEVGIDVPSSANDPFYKLLSALISCASTDINDLTSGYIENVGFDLLTPQQKVAVQSATLFRVRDLNARGLAKTRVNGGISVGSGSYSQSNPSQPDYISHEIIGILEKAGLMSYKDQYVGGHQHHDRSVDPTGWTWKQVKEYIDNKFLNIDRVVSKDGTIIVKKEFENFGPLLNLILNPLKSPKPDPTKEFTGGTGDSTSPSLSRQLFNDRGFGIIAGIDTSDPQFQFIAQDQFGKGVLAVLGALGLFFAENTTSNNGVSINKSGITLKRANLPDIFKGWYDLLNGGGGGATKDQVYAFNAEIFQNGTYTSIGADSANKEIQVNVDVAGLFTEITASDGIKKESQGLGDGFNLSLDNPPFVKIDSSVTTGAQAFNLITANDIGKMIFIKQDPDEVGWFGNPDFTGIIVARSDDQIVMKGWIANPDFDFISITLNNDDNGGTAAFANHKQADGKTLGDEFGATIGDVKNIYKAGTGITFTLQNNDQEIVISTSGGSGGQSWVLNTDVNFNVALREGLKGKIEINGAAYYGTFSKYGFYGEFMSARSGQSKPTEITMARVYIEARVNESNWKDPNQVKIITQMEVYASPAKPQRNVINNLLNETDQNTLRIYEWK